MSRRDTTTTLRTLPTAVLAREGPWTLDEAQLAAAAFLARYSGRTLEGYRFDLRCFFQWVDELGFDVLALTRVHIELYRSHMEQRGLAPSTIDRRLSTVCGYFEFAHSDGRVPANPAQYVRRPKVQPSEHHGMDRGELGRFLFTAEQCARSHAALAVLLGLNGLRVTEACETNIEDLGFERGTSNAAYHRQGQQAGHDPARSAHGAHGRSRDRRARSRSDPDSARWPTARSAHRSPLGAIDRQARRPGSNPSPHAARRFIMAALDAGVPLRDVQLAARHADPRTTTIYDHRRQNFDRHAADVVVAFVAGG
jgi:site-specific recombinase XerD